MGKLESLYIKGSLTQSCNYIVITLICKVTKKVIKDQTSTFLNSRKLLHTINMVFESCYTLSICFFSFNTFVSVLFVWQQFKRLCYRYDSWYDFN